MVQNYSESIARSYVGYTGCYHEY